MLFLILSWILYCIAEGFDHAWYETINHLRSSVRRIALGICVVYSYCGVGAEWALYINMAIMLAALFTIAFDVAFNLSRGKPWSYIGETSELDKIFRKHPRTAWGAKFFVAGASVIVQLYQSTFAVMSKPLINVTWLF